MLRLTEATRIGVPIPEKGSYALNDIQEHTDTMAKRTNNDRQNIHIKLKIE
jgi:hypothetical protein